MKSIDLNADIGEADNPEWRASETAILSTVTSANIACGGHAGDKSSMAFTAEHALENNVTIGAHPAYPDRKNFGRLSLKLGEDIQPKALKEALRVQILDLIEITTRLGGTVKYIKPHGALYNDAIFDDYKAKLIGEVIAKLDLQLSLLGGPNSEMEKAAKMFELGFTSEGFIDRRYTDDGHLLSRKIDGAVIKDQMERIEQAKSLALSGQVTTHSGQILKLKPNSLCVHGDSAGAVKTALEAREALENSGLKIRAFA